MHSGTCSFTVTVSQHSQTGWDPVVFSLVRDNFSFILTILTHILFNWEKEPAQGAFETQRGNRDLE